MADVFFFYERISNNSVQDVGHFFRRLPYGNLTTVCTEMLITEDVIWLFAALKTTILYGHINDNIRPVPLS